MTDIPNTPRVSTDNIHIHPDYKIYRRSASKSSLKTVLSSVSSKLRSGSEHFWGSLFSLSHDESAASSSSSRHSKVIHYLASRYALLLRQRHGLANPTAAAHSAAIGARIASVSDSADYVIPKYCSPATPVSFISHPSKWNLNPIYICNNTFYLNRAAIQHRARICHLPSRQRLLLPKQHGTVRWNRPEMQPCK